MNTPTAVVTGKLPVGSAVSSRWRSRPEAGSSSSTRATSGDLHAVAEELRAAGAAGVTALAGSVAEPEHRMLIAEAVDALGGLDLLVNNASLLGPSPQPMLADYPLDMVRQVYEVNVFAPLALTQSLLAALRLRSGTIVNVTSDAAVELYDGWGGYGSSKAALDQLTAILAVEEPTLEDLRLRPGRHADPHAPGGFPR